MILTRYFGIIKKIIKSNKDTWNVMPSANFLFYYNAGVSGILNGKKRRYPIFDSFVEDIKKEGYTINRIALPSSRVDLDPDECFTFFRQYYFRKALCKTFAFLPKTYCKIQLNAFYTQLNRFQPKAVFVSNAPDELCEAGKLLGIPVIEIEHSIGLIYEDSWSWIHRPVNLLPDGVLCFDAVTAMTHEKLYREKGYPGFVKIVPHPYLKKTSLIKDEETERGVKEYYESRRNIRNVP